MQLNTIPKFEQSGYSSEDLFLPSSILDEVDGAFEGLRQRTPNAIAGRIGAIALKTIPDCNFRCAKDPETGLGYDCYEYTDDTWQNLPERMPREVLWETGIRIGEYAKTTEMRQMQIIFHGGEPLFTHDAASYYDTAIDALEDAVRSVNENLTLQYGMHTNASLLTQSTLEMIKRRNIMVSCSIDGNEDAHNRNRKTKVRGLGTFTMVDRGIRRLAERCNEECGAQCTAHFGEQFSGLLAVIDLRNDPIETYEQLCSYGAKRVDFMLPYANHDNPPEEAPDGGSSVPYADWLLTIHRRWISDQKTGKQVPDIRQFSSIANLARGLPSSTEALGPLTSSVVFIRADGTLEGTDALKTASRGAVETNMNVFDNSFEDVAQRLRTLGQLGRKSIAAACSDCKLLEICGGGHLESRYSSDKKFDNASVFCEDLKVLIKEIVATTNAEYCDEVANNKLQSITQEMLDSGVRANMHPLYPPSRSTPIKRRLAMRIRPAEPEDVTNITDLHGLAYAANYRHEIPPDVLDAYVGGDLLARKHTYWQEQIELARRSDDRLFVATLGRVTIGFAALKVHSMQPNTALLNALYVSPELDGYGIDNQLLAQTEGTFGRPLVIQAQAASRSPQTTHLHERGFTKGNFKTQEPRIGDYLLKLLPMERRPYFLAKG